MHSKGRIKTMAEKNTQAFDEAKFQERLNELLATAKKKS